MLSRAESNAAQAAPTLSCPRDLTFLTERAERIRVLGKRVTGDVIEIGRLLADCRERCGHGHWGAWLESEFGWSADTAERFIRLNKLADQIPQIAEYDIPVSGLYLLAAPATPESARAEVVERAESGERLKHAEVQEIIANHSPAAVREASKQIRAERTAVRHAEWTARTIEISKQNAPLSCDRKYPVILADPPWKFTVYDAESGMEQAAETHYPTLCTDEICALPVADLATPDAVLFLWCTSPQLFEAQRVIETWGFTYRANIIWVKQGPPGLGFWLRNQHEILLIAARGGMRTPPPPDRPLSVIQAPRREHSRKPDEAQATIERMYPDLPKIELFARRDRPGWDAWGNEAPPRPAAPDDLKIASPRAAPVADPSPPTAASDDGLEIPPIFRRRRPA